MENYVCKLCGNNTDWDSSVGLENFLVCNSCVRHISETYKPVKLNTFNVVGIIRLMGEMMKSIEDTED